MSYNPYQAPEQHDEALPIVAPADNEAPLATRGQRLGAGIIDLVIVSVVILPAQFIIAKTFHLQLWNLSPIGKDVWRLVTLVTDLCFNGYLLATRSQSIGKRWMKVRITDVRGGSPTSFARIVVRRILPIYLTGMIPIAKVGAALVLLDLLFIFGESRRCLHDRIAGTVVRQLP